MSSILEEHLQKDHADIEARLTLIERRQDLIEDIQKRVVNLECNFRNTSAKVDILMTKMDAFAKDMQREFTEFTNRVRDVNSHFVFWLVGTILISLIVGLFCQYKAFQDITANIHGLDSKILLINRESTVKEE